MILEFSKPIFVIRNVTLIDTTVLNITVKSDYVNDKRNLNLTWTTLNMTANQIQIQLRFQDASQISALDVI